MRVERESERKRVKRKGDSDAPLEPNLRLVPLERRHERVDLVVQAREAEGFDYN